MKHTLALLAALTMTTNAYAFIVLRSDGVWTLGSGSCFAFAILSAYVFVHELTKEKPLCPSDSTDSSTP